MKHVFVYILTILSISSFAQDKDKEKEALLALKKANNYVFEGNEKAVNDDFVSAEMAYRQALSEQSSSVAGAYNLGTSYYKNENYTEALFRLQQAVKSATSKEEKHKAFHNIGNILMKEKRCKEAVEAYKSALRNNPSDDETRYNFGLAKECAEQQKNEQPDDNKDDQNRDKDQDQNQDENQDENQDNKDQDKGDNKEDNKDQGDQDKKEGDDEKDDEGKPKEDENQGKGKDEKQDQQKPEQKPGQLSPQQVKNLLEAMNNQEQKVQEKMNAEKQKGVKVESEKDW
ncbi:tetratricopeptide repeat protein [Xanthomarina sp. F1114]|uniref:tetratricopeptide repeat protein n=1 Tax=Xanthomarina sp. F1114 TaxID=2996019 RepID=UPI00225E0F9A|nr:tetratricopeptide repeat protein [Xanthomarina sp. F1114]MCX7546476.1 tetratricopeptide repeat protein [Xanthomarina sp. F1114]